MTPIETLLEWLGDNHYYIGNDLLEKVEEFKQMEKLKNHSEYMSGWYNGFNGKEIETKGLEQTAVEWLTEKLRTEFGFAFSNNILNQAKEMEKQQIVSAFNKGFVTDQWDKSKDNKSEQYYNKTFKSE